jgi:hypothetical protein
MAKHKRTPKAVLRLPDLEQSKTAVLEMVDSGSAMPSMITSASSQPRRERD